MVDAFIYKQLDNTINKKVKLYFSCGSKDLKQVKKWNEKLYQTLQDRNLRHIDWENEIYYEETHITSVNISLLKGLQY